MKDDLIKKNPLCPDLQPSDTPKSHDKVKKRLGPIVVDRDLLSSEAWLELPPGIASQVYMLFLCKRRMEKTSRKGGRLICTNNGELVFPYKAAEKLGITSPRFTRAIDALIEHGFLEITEAGNSATRECTKYAISEKWRDFGKPGYLVNKRLPAARGGSKDPFGHKTKDKILGGKKQQAPPQLIDSPQITEAARTMAYRCSDCRYFETQDCKRYLRRSNALKRRSELFKVDESRGTCDAFEKKPS